jgi:predicted N-acyltransferase
VTAARLTILERAEDLPPVWERVARGRMLSLDPRFLRTLQSSVTDGANRRYLVYEPESGPTVIAAAVLLEPPAARNPVASVLLGRHYRRLPASQNWLLPMLVLRAEIASDAPYCTDAAQAGREAALHGLLSALEDHAERKGWSLALDSIPADDPAMSAACAERGYLRTLARPCAEMRIEWDTWEGYLKSAASHSKRAAANIRTELNHARRNGLAIAEWCATATPESDLHRLLVEHEARLDERESLFRPGLFGRLSEALGSDFKVFLATCGGRLQGVVAFIRSGNRGYVTYAGLLHENERAGSAYFNLMYYYPIRLAIELRLESIAFGNGVLAAKIRRGCTVRAGALCFRPRGRILRMALVTPVALHRRGLLHKYASFLGASPFYNHVDGRHASPGHQRTP